MAFANVAGRAGFVLELDKSQLDRGLPEAERQFNRATSNMAASASRSGVSSRRGFEDLLTSVRGMRAEADTLSDQIDKVGTSSDGMGTSVTMAAGKVGLVAFAASAAYQAMGHLRDSLETTGAQAFTTEGKLRNMTAALTKGDIVGAWEAWRVVPKTLEDAGISAKYAADHLGEFAKVALGEVKPGADQSREAMEEWNRVTDITRTGNQELAASALELGRAYQEMAKQTRDALNATLGFRNPSGQVVVGGTPGQQLGLAGGGAPVPSFGTPLRTRSNVSVLQGQLSVAQRSGDLNAQESILQDLAGIVRKRVQIVKQEGPLLEQRRKEEQAVLAQLDAVRDQQAAQAKAAKDAADASKKAAAEKAASAAAQAAADRKAAIEQGLENEIAKAALTKRKSDDKKAFDAAIDYWRSLAAHAKNAKDREDAQAKVIALRSGLAAAMKGDTPAAGSDEARQLRELKMANNVARAALTERTSDDRKFLNQQLNYYIGLRKDLLEHGKRLEAEQQTSTIIGIRGRLAALKTAKAAESASEVFNRMAADFLTNLHGITNQFGNNFSADGAQTATNTWQTAKLTERLVGSVDRLTSGVAHPGAKYARVELMEPFGAEGSV